MILTLCWIVVCIVSGLEFKSSIHLEWLFVCCEKYGSNFILLTATVSSVSAKATGQGVVCSGVFPALEW